MKKIKLLPFLLIIFSCHHKEIDTTKESYKTEITLKESEVLIDFEVYKERMYLVVKDTVTNKSYIITKYPKILN